MEVGPHPVLPKVLIRLTRFSPFTWSARIVYLSDVTASAGQLSNGRWVSRGQTAPSRNRTTTHPNPSSSATQADLVRLSLPAVVTIRRRFARRIAAAYFAFAGIWILTSDLALYRFAEHFPDTIGGSLAKGLLFVSVTTWLLYSFVSYEFRPFSEAGERQRAERKLSEAVERYHALFERSLDWIFLCDFEGRFLDANEAALSRLGYTREEIRSVSFWTLLRSEDVTRARQALQQAITGGTQGHRYAVRRKDGREVVVEVSASVVHADGKPWAVQGIARDITEHERAEEDLRQSERRFRVMVEQSISGFYLIRDGTFRYVNPRLAQIFGYSAPPEVIGLTPAELTAENDRALVAGNIGRRLSGDVESLSYTFTGLRKDGTTVEVGVHGSRIISQGRPAIMGLLQDITDRKDAERKIQRYITQLEQAMQSTIDVVATMGELRDPYTHGHEGRVGQIAAALAAELGLSALQVEGVRVAGYLHDVGKIAVPAEILSKPSLLTKAELALVKEHAEQSYEILKTVPFPWPVAEAARQHHERLDGSGYPRGLKGDAIILEARILGVADTVESMASHRPYRPSLGLDAALAEIAKGRGTLYDPQVVDACLRLFREKGYKLPPHAIAPSRSRNPSVSSGPVSTGASR